MISIIPSGRSLGRAWLTDTHDRLVHSRSALIDEMAILLGGRAAELLMLGQAGSSAHGDLAEIGRISHYMVRELGMSDVVGPIGYPEDADLDGHVLQPSDETIRTIDSEARKFVDEAVARADAVLRTNRDSLERVIAALLEHETLSAAQIERLLIEPAAAGAPA
jgi:cell division protease FtsH